MSTCHEYGIQAAFEAAVQSEPKWPAFLIDVRNKIQSGVYGPEILVDALFQQERGELPLEQVYAFCAVWSKLVQGDIAIVYVEVDGEPAADSAHERNQSMLNTIHPSFSAEVIPQRGRSAHSDGIFQWRDPIEFKEINHDRWVIEPTALVPLEIGSTKMSRTFLHLAERGSLARWPYGHRQICVLTQTCQGLLFPRNSLGIR